MDAQTYDEAIDQHKPIPGLASSCGSIKVTEVKRALPDLQLQCQDAIDAQEAFTDACKAVAEKAGIEASVLKSYVTAVVKDKLKAQQEKAEQMSFLLEEFG